ncbi:MAG: hypothetical protein M1830_009570 [Pleopsidium flavum]|nr:MAG: hypothetical protein M1830_009582 [Pleopsidium flavum]KAI9874605.1 MAG: hypothetical protein M1830_009570 [Pleopsidium flavum]
MPAPLAKGLIITFSILVAAGLAVYENPQVREWVESSRRKIAIALHSLGDDIDPSRSPSPPDPSTRPYDSPEAVERRRRAREEILERGRVLEEKRRRARNGERSSSFDDLVNEDGKLKKEIATTTATETKPEEEGMKNRSNGIQGLEKGAAFANPFADENENLIDAEDNEQQRQAPAQTSRESTATLPRSTPPQHQTNPKTTSNHPSEQLLDLTPTTSSSSHDPFSLQTPPQPPIQPSNYFSVNEWAESTSPSFYSAVPDPGEQNRSEAREHPSAASLAGSGEDVGADSSTDGDLDVISEIAGVSTPGSWTEVGSEVSEGDHGQ